MVRQFNDRVGVPVRYYFSTNLARRLLRRLQLRATFSYSYGVDVSRNIRAGIFSPYFITRLVWINVVKAILY